MVLFIRRFRSLLLFAAILLVACTPRPVVWPQGITAQPLALSSVERLYDLDDLGQRLLLAVDGRFSLVELESGVVTRISNGAPVHAVFATDGRIAAAWSSAQRSRLVRYDKTGLELSSISLAGQVAGLAWLGEDLLATVNQLEVFSFGVNLKTWLHHWSGDRAAADKQLLGDVTLRKKWLGSVSPVQAAGNGSFKLSPLGDEIALLRLRDPPAFSAHYELLVVRLDRFRETLIDRFGLQPLQPVFSGDGDLLWGGDRGARLRLFDRWRQKELPATTISGDALRFDPRARLLWQGNTLRLDQRKLGDLPGDDLRFAPGLGRAVLLKEGRVYLLSGLPTGSPISPEVMARKLMLRDWLNRGLISLDDYLTQGDTQ